MSIDAQRNKTLASSLQPWIGLSPKTAQERRAMRAAAWHKLCIIGIIPEEIIDERARYALCRLADKRYGVRMQIAASQEKV